jgi:hypothetical protein
MRATRDHPHSLDFRLNSTNEMPLIPRSISLQANETLPNMRLTSIERDAQISVELHELRASRCVRFAQSRLAARLLAIDVS